MYCVGIDSNRISQHTSAIVVGGHDKHIGVLVYFRCLIRRKQRLTPLGNEKMVAANIVREPYLQTSVTYHTYSTSIY